MATPIHRNHFQSSYADAAGNVHKIRKKDAWVFLEKVKWTNVFSVSSTSCMHWPHTVGLNLGGRQGASPRVEMSTLIRVFAREKCDSWIQIWWVHKFFGGASCVPKEPYVGRGSSSSAGSFTRVSLWGMSTRVQRWLCAGDTPPFQIRPTLHTCWVASRAAYTRGMLLSVSRFGLRVSVYVATTCQTMVDVRSVLPVLTSGTHFLSISGNKHQ